MKTIMTLRDFRFEKKTNNVHVSSSFSSISYLGHNVILCVMACDFYVILIIDYPCDLAVYENKHSIESENKRKESNKFR